MEEGGSIFVGSEGVFYTFKYKNIMSIFSKIGGWFAKTFKSLKADGAKIAVAITEGLQTALKSGTLVAVADLVSVIFPNVRNLPQEIIADLNAVLPKILAAELAIEGLPDHPTEKDILDFENMVLAAFKIHDDKSKLWTVLSSQIYGILRRHVGDPQVTFFELAADVEEAFLDYKQDLVDTGQE
jgi:hypothetical protein